MNRYTIVMVLGALNALLGGWFFLVEFNYAQTNQECIYGYSNCLAENLQVIGIAQILGGIAILIIGLQMKENQLKKNWFDK